ncbi:uncharacterized protein LOC132890681 [Neoarius graeffei]|uniref:uncharacterized protein LOC132890681 n=1 Tax=Neoarius graeffei TaxID=443677 RepID=UPI00298C3C36|nr:uncharacterized protein LOC132890681 [Neoarius graeffei]
MEARFIVVVVFVCAVCHLTEAKSFTTTALTANINDTECGRSKLCVSSAPNCNPEGNASCFFISTQFSNAILTVELSGTTSGYVALGLNNSAFAGLDNVVLVCGNNESSAFFETAKQNGSALSGFDVPIVTIPTIQGAVTGNQTHVQCIISVNTTGLPVGSQLPFIVTIFNGTTNGTKLGNPGTVFTSNRSLDLANPTSNARFDITRNGCGISKLCISSSSGCDLAGNSNCFFSSIQVKNQSFFIELSGTTTGYVALGLGKQGTTYAFACGKNNNNFFFQTATQNGTVLTPANVTTVHSAEGKLAPNTPLQCIFNISSSFNNISSKAEDTQFNVTILNGTTNGTSLGNATTQLKSSGALDLASPISVSNDPFNITRNGCGISKLCISSSSDCDLAGNSNCFFSSIQVKNQSFFIELSGTTTGYVALGLSKQGTTYAFVCGNNSNNFFFQTATQKGTVLTFANVTTVHSVEGRLAPNKPLQCIFNISSSFNNISSKAEDNQFDVTILSGTTNGTSLGNATTQFKSNGALDLASPINVSNDALQLNITRNGCNSSKRCFSNVGNCEPAKDSNCYFSSVKVNNQKFLFELTGSTLGYVALGLTKKNSTFVFVCANNNSSANNRTFFFEKATKNGTTLTLANVTTVFNNQGEVAKNQNLIQCIFNTSTTFNISTKGEDEKYQLMIMNGTTTGTKLGDVKVLFDTKSEVDLSDPSGTSNSNTVIASLYTNVFAVLLSALTLRLL